jgi:hypothetical protein
MKDPKDTSGCFARDWNERIDLSRKLAWEALRVKEKRGQAHPQLFQALRQVIFFLEKQVAIVP